MLPADDRMDALTEAIVSVRRRMDSIDRRLARMEAARGIAAEPQQVEPPPLPPPLPPPPIEQAPEPAAPIEPRPLFPPPVEPVPEAEAETAAEPESTRALETRVGLTWINRIGVVTSVLAVAFFFKYAVDSHWIGEAGRVMLGVAAGLAMLAFGERTWRQGHRIYAQGITATGIAILYLSFWAAFQLYHLEQVPQSFAFLLMMMTTALAGALAIHYGAVAISILALLGGFLTPILLSTNVDRPWSLFSYLLLLDVGAMVVARTQRWRALGGLALAGTAVLYASWFSERFNSEKQLVAAVFALVYYALFAVAVESDAALVVSQLLANMAILAIWAPPAAASLWFALALAAAGLELAERRRQPLAQVAAFGAFWGLAALWRLGPSTTQHMGETVLVFTAGFLLFLGWVAWRLLIKRFETRTQDLAIVVWNGAAYFGLTYYLLDPEYHAYMGLFAAALAGLHLALGLRLWNTQPEDRRDVRPVLLLIGVALTFLTLAAPIQFSSYQITMAWAVEAAALVWIGIRTGAGRLSYAGLAVFVLTLARLYAVDSWIYDHPSDYHLLANARFLTFLTAAVSMWLSARWLRTGVTALSPYVAGHFVLLWALALEILGWAERSTPAANLASVETTSISVLMAAYGAVLVALGVLTRAGVNRMLGLGLLGVVVAKLYLYDVWQLEKVYRIVAFSFLGVVLLATSFLYSQYRAKIESWWRDDENHS
jgi:uncharacterized membrane protein